MARRRPRNVVLSSSSDEDDDSREHTFQPNVNYSHLPEVDIGVSTSVLPAVGTSAEAEAVESGSAMDVQLEDTIPSVRGITLNSGSSLGNTTISDPILVEEVSDEDFIDVSNHLSPRSLPTVASASADERYIGASSGTVASSVATAGSPESDVLRKLGLHLETEWLSSCIQCLKNSVPGFSFFDVETKAKLCFEQVLLSDMNLIGGGILPQNVQSMHLVDLAGPFVLQVDEVINISSCLKQRYQNAPAGPKRCLKLSMTDGVQRVFGMEYRPIKDLEPLAPAGFKVVLKNVVVRRGILLLVPEMLEILGGSVKELEAARQRLVEEVKKPPSGKRSRTETIAPLATRATRAAWPSTPANTPMDSTTSGGQINTSQHQQLQGAPRPVNGANDDLMRGRMAESAMSYGRETSQLPLNGDNSRPATRVEASNASTSNRIVGDEGMFPVNVPQHPSSLRGNQEAAFTYLASLSAKWVSVKGKVPSIQGKIKCFLAGVKGFDYKKGTQFELTVYVDDGSLISEILVHHNVLLKRIGHSPQEVTAALSSLDLRRRVEMKETLKKFQLYLANFEGIVTVEMNETSGLPIAIEMKQGCSVATAWSMIRRVRNLISG